LFTFASPVARALQGADVDHDLWQLQLAGDKHKRSSTQLGFGLMKVVKDAILEHPNPNVRTLQDVERTLRIRLILGGPAQTGLSDPDEVGIADWQLVFYSCGLGSALDFIHFILDYKVRKNLLGSMPQLAVHVAYAGGSPLPAVPPPWKRVDGAALAMPKPYGALPPRGRRHALAHLDRQQVPASQENSEQDEETTAGQANHSAMDFEYTLTFYGYLYPFKDRFENAGVPGTFAPTNTSGQKDYVRYLRINADDTSKQKVCEVRETVLKGLPVYLINGDADPMALWLQQRPSIQHVEAA
jgi:hypothetical protein